MLCSITIILFCNVVSVVIIYHIYLSFLIHTEFSLKIILSLLIENGVLLFGYYYFVNTSIIVIIIIFYGSMNSGGVKTVEKCTNKSMLMKQVTS